MIFGGAFHSAGVPKPLSELEKIPAVLRKPHYILRHDPDYQSPDNLTPSLNIQLGEQMSVDEFGHRRSKKIQREALNLAAADEQQRQLEESLGQRNETEEEALRIIQEDHEIMVARDKAAAIYQAKQNDMSLQLAREAQEEQDSEIAQLSNNLTSPTIETESDAYLNQEPDIAPKQHLESEPQPKKVRTRYVKRFGNQMVRARKVKCRIGEEVFVKDGDAQFTKIGKVSKRGKLPTVYVQEEAA